jgi:two-component system response regulator NreC
MADKIRVLIADDHTIVRSGVRLLLESWQDIEVVGEATNGQEAIDLTVKFQPDIILMDIAMPVIDGLEATHHIKSHWPQVQILVLTMHRSDEYFFEMLKAGASGYILKAAGTEELVKAVRTVARGDVFLYPTMAKKLLSDYLDRVGGNGNQTRLSPRESEIVQLVAQGYTNNEIAEKLVISPSTVHTHRGNIMNKLGLDSRRELIRYARRNGMITESDSS